jgi:DNA-binding response OmpR family regulator
LLLVDDDILVCSALSRSLIRLGHASRTATSVDGALELLDSEAPTAVLTDLDLGPGRSGVDLITELRRRGYARPAILMTGSDLALAHQRLADAGLGDVRVLAKPFELGDLLNVLGEVLPAAPARRSPSSTMGIVDNVVRALGGGRVM